jgi:hypothetical protein
MTTAIAPLQHVELGQHLNLMAEAVKLGLKISEGARSDLDLLNEPDKNFWPPYPKKTGDPVFLIVPFRHRDAIDSAARLHRPRRQVPPSRSRCF